MRTLSKLMIGLITACLLTSCSTLRIGYGFADWYIVNEIDNMFDLNRTQEQKVNELVDRLHEWHRTEEIPRTIELLDQAKTRIQGNISKEDLDWMYVELNKMKARMVEQVIDDVSVLLTTLSDEQIGHLEQALVEHNVEDEEAFAVPLDEWEAEKEDQFVSNLEDWFGSVSADQKQKLFNVYRFDRSVHKRYHDQSVKTQKRFVALLRSKPTAEEIKSILSQWMSGSDSFYSADYRRFRERQSAHQVMFYLTLDQSITEQQRQAAIKRLDDYRSDLVAIHKSS